jgi:hypothetical protein
LKLDSVAEHSPFVHTINSSVPLQHSVFKPPAANMDLGLGGRRVRRVNLLLVAGLLATVAVAGVAIHTLQATIRTMEVAAHDSATRLASVEHRALAAVAATPPPAAAAAVAAACPEATPATAGSGVTTASSMFPHVHVTPSLMAAFERYAVDRNALRTRLWSVRARRGQPRFRVGYVTVAG